MIPANRVRHDLKREGPKSWAISGDVPSRKRIPESDSLFRQIPLNASRPLSLTQVMYTRRMSAMTSGTRELIATAPLC